MTFNVQNSSIYDYFSTIYVQICTIYVFLYIIVPGLQQQPMKLHWPEVWKSAEKKGKAMRQHLSEAGNWEIQVSLELKIFRIRYRMEKRSRFLILQIQLPVLEASSGNLRQKAMQR